MNIIDNIENEPKLVLAFDAKRVFGNFTGLGNYSRSLLKNLQLQYPQHEYHLFTPKVKKNEETAYFIDADRFIIHTPKVNTPLWRTFGMAGDINALKPHIFHGLSHEISFGIHPSIKTVVTFHDLIFEKFSEQFGLWDRMLYKLKYRASARRAHKIIAISESTKSDLINLYTLPADKIHVIYQSCNPLFQQENEVEDISHPTLIGIENYYLYVGSIIERKGLLSIVFAFSRLEDKYRKPFVIIGGKSKSPYRKKVDEMIRYHELDEYFYFIDGLTNDDLISVYDHSFALIFPSIYEGFGIPVIESLFRSKPVVTSDHSSLPEAAGPGGLLINPYEPDDIAIAMMQLHNNDVYQTLSSEGNKYVKSKFSSEWTSQRLMDFYLNLVSE